MKTPQQARFALLGAAVVAIPTAAFGQDATADLAKAAQNPVASMISLPIQANINFGTGSDDTQLINLIQPVLPQSLNEDWNWIHRGIIPVPMGADNHWGMGDIQYQGFLSPAKPGKWIWGVGPYVSLPTATDDVLGTEQYSMGPAVLVLTMPKTWVVGGLFTQLWDIEGDDDRDGVNLSSFQPIINYNIPDCNGWYLSSTPVWTYNWEADSDNAWTIPVGGGVGKVFHIGEQAVNAKIQAFGYLEAPDNGPDWSVQLQFTLLFPK